MTRLPVPLTPPPKPASLTLGELAIAAGAAGRSVTLYFQDFPAAVLCRLWKYYTQFAGWQRCRHVRSPLDARKLAGLVLDVGLAFVHNPRLSEATSWAVQMATPQEEGRISRPAIFCRGGLGDVDDDPGTTLVLQGNLFETTTLERWFVQPDTEFPDWDVIPRNVDIQIDPRVSEVLLADVEASGGLGGLRDREVVEALVIGVSLLRVLRRDGIVLEPHVAGVEDYEVVRRLLQTRLVAGADEVRDPLAADMVARANIYLGVKHSSANDNPFGGSQAGADHGQRRPRELVTRREIADLGNLRSRMVRRLVEFLRRQPDGYERFRRMGLVRRPPDAEVWPRTEVEVLATCLRPWSAKQIRTHFDPLRKSGMIVAEREHGNSPWRYMLPEDLVERAGIFRRLPAIQPGGHPAEP